MILHAEGLNETPSPAASSGSAQDEALGAQVGDLISRHQGNPGRAPAGGTAGGRRRPQRRGIRRPGQQRNELAQRAKVSEPTVTRFCRALGCDGVRDFKLKLAQSLVVGSMYFREPPAVQDSSERCPTGAEVFRQAGNAIASRRAATRRGSGPPRGAASGQRPTGLHAFGVGWRFDGAGARDAQYRLFRYGLAASPPIPTPT